MVEALYCCNEAVGKEDRVLFVWQVHARRSFLPAARLSDALSRAHRLQSRSDIISSYLGRYALDINWNDR